MTLPLTPSSQTSLLGACASFPTLQVVDYGGGNIGSLSRCLERLAWPYQRVTHGSELLGTYPMMVPGVGAFGAVMQALHDKAFVEPLRQYAMAGTPLMGVCVGQQVLFESSEESPGVSGLGILKGHVKKLQAPRIPQIGWNTIVRSHTSSYQGEGVPTHGAVYFVNSYVAHPTEPSDTLYHAVYEEESFCAAVYTRHGGKCIGAFQFHPEKSGGFGHTLLAQTLSVLVG